MTPVKQTNGLFCGLACLESACIDHGIQKTQESLNEQFNFLNNGELKPAHFPSIAFLYRSQTASSPLRKMQYWVTPKLVCQVAFLEWTDAGHLRHCTFVVMHDDKKPAEVVREAYVRWVDPSLVV